MIFPNKLKPRDNIGLICPSSPTNSKNIDMCIKVIEEIGFNPVIGKSVYSLYGGYLSGCDKIRANDVNNMFEDKNINAIFCVRGGYGSIRILDMLDYEMIKRNPKIFLGYSDITNLHIALNQKCKLVTYHGPMVTSNMIDEFDKFSKESLFSMLNFNTEINLTNPYGIPFETLVAGYAEGILIGGNLSLIVKTIGTQYEINTKNKILFIEDLDETVGRLDGMMYQLKLSNKFNDASGIIFGDFKNCENKDDPNYDYLELIKDVLKDYKKPVMYNIKSGHCKPMSTLVFGSKCIMNTTDDSIKFIN